MRRLVRLGDGAGAAKSCAGGGSCAPSGESSRPASSLTPAGWRQVNEHRLLYGCGGGAASSICQLLVLRRGARVQLAAKDADEREAGRATAKE